MTMQKSIFSKYFTICAALILTSIVILGTVFLGFAAQYNKTQTFDSLNRNAKSIGKLFAEYSAGTSGFTQTTFDVYLKNTAETLGAQIFITDAEGKTIYCTEQTPCRHTAQTIPSDIITTLVTTGNYAELGKLGGVYDGRYHTVAVTAAANLQTFCIFVSVYDTGQQQVFLNELIKMFLISAAVVLVIASIAVYFISVQLVKPLRQMSEAAKKFGRGEFDTRLEVTSYDEMGQLAMSLNQMAQSLSTTESARRSFTANISHELKTPMTTISGFVDGILDGTIPPEKQRHYLTIVSEETKRLSRLVRTMLNLSRIEAGEMQMKRTKFNIVDTICQTVFLFEKQIEEKHLEVRGLDHEKVMVEADPDLMYQVVYNLTENAVKFVNDGGYLAFDFSSDAKHIYVSVKNSGTGLTKEEIPKIFDRFYKTDRSRGLDKNGVGLGLYIVRSIVSLHGGEIIVRSTEGEFVEFMFSLPYMRQGVKFKKNAAAVLESENE